MSSRSIACVVPYGRISTHTNFALGLRRRNFPHSVMTAVPTPRFASTQDWLSETITTKSAVAPRAFQSAKGALQFVPPPPMAASFSAFVITVSRGFNSISTTLSSKGLSTAVGFFRTNAAVTGAATSMQRTFEVAPFRRPVIASDIEPDTSGQTKTLPSITGTEEMAISIAAESTDVLYCDPDRCPRYGQNRFSCCPSPNHLFDIHYPDLPVRHAQPTSSLCLPYPLMCPKWGVGE